MTRSVFCRDILSHAIYRRTDSLPTLRSDFPHCASRRVAPFSSACDMEHHSCRYRTIRYHYLVANSLLLTFIGFSSLRETSSLSSLRIYLVYCLCGPVLVAPHWRTDLLSRLGSAIIDDRLPTLRSDFLPPHGGLLRRSSSSFTDVTILLTLTMEDLLRRSSSSLPTLRSGFASSWRTCCDVSSSSLPTLRSGFLLAGTC
jgi:hypothetical protein